MPYYVIRQLPPGATLKDAADGLVIEFSGNMMQMAEKLASRDTDASRPKKLKKRRGTHPQKGELRPNPKDGKASARVMVLRALLKGPVPAERILADTTYAGNSTVRQALTRNLEHGYMTQSDEGVCVLTPAGATALRRFDDQNPNLAQSAQE